jgi:hypothetical protein
MSLIVQLDLANELTSYIYSSCKISQVDLDSSLADLGDGDDAQGAFPLLLIQTLLLLNTFAISESPLFR